MYRVRGRKVQDVARSSRVHRLSNKLQLACGELNFGQLHLQRGLLWPRWRGLLGMCRREVEKRGRVGQLRRLPDKRRLT